MKLEYKDVEEVIFGKTGFRRFTQDSPILPDVWMEFGDKPCGPCDLLLTPTWGSAPGHLSVLIEERLKSDDTRESPRSSEDKKEAHAVAYNGSTVAIQLYFDEMIRVILPITDWWEKYIVKDDKSKAFLQRIIKQKKVRDELSDLLAGTDWDLTEINKILKGKKIKTYGFPDSKLPAHLIWLIKIVGLISWAQGVPPDEKEEAASPKKDPLKNVSAIIEAFADTMRGIGNVKAGGEAAAVVWAVNLNRKASAMIWRSTPAVKADASRRLFQIKCDDIRWAVIDSGIDATHPAFRKKKADGKFEPQPFRGNDNCTRVVKTFDFTPIRQILSQSKADFADLSKELQERFKDKPLERQALQRRLQQGRAVDWDILAPLLEIPHKKGEYVPPVFEHGTHVAGIMAADWKADKNNENGFDIQGVCPDLALYDLRVLDKNGEGDEFSVLAALQFAQYINTNSEYPRVHGVNLSLSIRHKVKNFACGCTPVCEEAERLVSSGLVVVAAAGNDGYLESPRGGGSISEGYRSISITDPGNAQSVITVGATHRDSPHTYGVSYFSSRGPTGDGRIKPDLVAPGEKITSTVPDDSLKTMDGTSMAAPHVSGAAALLIGRYRELIDKPVRVKEILCETATDLGRERYFQGHGMLDILRAMQSV